MKVCAWWHCSHPVEAHTAKHGCTDRIAGRQCLCYFNAREARAYVDPIGFLVANAWRSLHNVATGKGPVLAWDA